MFNYLATEYTILFSYLNLFNYITFRTGAAILTSLFFSLSFGEMIIKFLSNTQPSCQPIRKDGPENHILKKTGTPTMGGILIILLPNFFIKKLLKIFIKPAKNINSILFFFRRFKILFSALLIF